jgi:reactive intermediate/imine deaminase
MTNEIISTDEAPRAVGPYSQAVVAGQLVFTAGQLGLDPTKMALVDHTAASQVRQVFENLRAIARQKGAGLGDIVKLTVYLTDLKDWPAVNEVMEELFEAPYPARSAVGVAELPLGACVEADAVIVIP